MKNSSNNNNLMPSHYNPDEFSQIHKTLSKSFVMQRKTLVRVLGLEGRVSELELQQAAEEQAKEGIDEILNDIHEAKEEEVGGTKTKTKAKPKAKAKQKVKPKAKKTKVKGKKINKPKIDADKFKRGTSQETLQERLERLEKNRQETAVGEEHKQTDEYKETATGTDEKGEYLSPEERKRRFKVSKFIPKTGFDSKDVKPETETEAEIGDDSKKDKIIGFLNGDVKDNLDDVRDDLKQIEGLLKDQNKSADDQYEDMRQGILTAKKKKREEDLEGKDKKPGSGLKDKMLDAITKPAGNFFNKIIKFITMTFLGSVVNRILGILKDPAQLLDPIKKFFNAIIGMVNVVIKALWDITGGPINIIIGGINDGAKFIIDSINSVSSKLNLPEIPEFSIPLVPGPPQVPEIPLSKTAQEKNEGAVGMAGGGLVPGYENGGVVTDPEERKQQEAYMLKFVNEERALQGMEPLNDLTYAPGVELTKMIGPGPRIEEQSNTNMDFDKGIKTTSKSRTVDGKTSISAEIGQTTEQDRQQFFAENPQAEQLLNIKNQVELDNLGASISAKAKMSGGGIVQNLNVRRQGFSGGGVVPYNNSFVLGTGHNVIDTAPGNIMGYNKGGKVPGSGTGDTVPAMLTPGEFVMSKGAVDKIGADNLMAMNKAGGGTNVPKMMKFAGGEIVPGIDAPTKRKGKLTVIKAGGGNKSSSMPPSSSGGDGTVKFSSTDPNNMTVPLVKSLYNMMG